MSKSNSLPNYHSFFKPQKSPQPNHNVFGLLSKIKKGRSIKFVEPRKEPKVYRNEPCPCGSGIKLKKCCGALVTH